MSDKDQAKQQADYDKKFTLTFTKRELTIIFNVLVREDDGKPKKHYLGDAAVLLNLLPKIEPYVVVDSNIEEPKTGEIITQTKAES